MARYTTRLKIEKKMSMLFEATFYVPSHDNSWADIRAARGHKITDLSM